MRKRILSMVCAICVLFLAGGEVVSATATELPELDDSAVAGSEEGIMPLWNNIDLYTTSISISGSTLNPYAHVGAKTKASITITMTLQKQPTGTTSSSWIDVKTWTASGTDTDLALSEEYTASRGYTYRTKAVYTVNGETITTYSTSRASY